MFSLPDVFRTCVLKVLSSVKSQPADDWEDSAQNGWNGWQGALTYLFPSTEEANLSSTRGRHFSTTQSNLSSVKGKTKHLHSKGKSEDLLIIHASDFIFKRNLHFSYGNSRLHRQYRPQFHPHCVQYYIAIFTVERTWISEWSVCIWSFWWN